MKEVSITAGQISDLKHAIGYKSAKIVAGRYYAWRNFFGVSKECPEWEDLISRGLATKNTVFKEVVYHVSDDGLKYLSEILDIEIVTEDPDENKES